MTEPPITLDGPPYRLTGTVLVALVNDPALIAALGPAADAAPYKGAPKAPVLGVKPRNTWAADGATIAVPPEGVVIAASLAAVIGQPACRVAEGDALACVAGYTLAVDLHLPPVDAKGHYRPAIRQRARDGFCPMGPALVPAAAVPDPDALAVSVQVDGRAVHASTTAGRTRNLARLIADVSDFMTLQPGDLLLLGAPADAPVARAGQAVQVTIQGLGSLAFALRAEAPPPGEGKVVTPTATGAAA